jgi:hypothetical protein
MVVCLTKPLREKWIASTGLIGMKDNLMLTDFLFVLMPVVRVVAKAAEYSKLSEVEVVVIPRISLS